MHTLYLIKVIGTIPKFLKKTENKISSWLVPLLAVLFLEACSFSVLFTKSQGTICQKEKGKTGINNNK